jgi:hypothetical protein
LVVMTVAGQTFVHGFLTALSGHRGDPPLRRVRGATGPVPAPVPTGQGRTGSYFDLVYAPPTRAPARRWCCRHPCSTSWPT